METSASFEARYAPLPYPTNQVDRPPASEDAAYDLEWLEKGNKAKLGLVSAALHDTGYCAARGRECRTEAATGGRSPVRYEARNLLHGMDAKFAWIDLCFLVKMAIVHVCGGGNCASGRYFAKLHYLFSMTSYTGVGTDAERICKGNQTEAELLPSRPKDMLKHRVGRPARIASKW